MACGILTIFFIFAEHVGERPFTGRYFQNAQMLAMQITGIILKPACSKQPTHSRFIGHVRSQLFCLPTILNISDRFV